MMKITRRDGSVLHAELIIFKNEKIAVLKWGNSLELKMEIPADQIESVAQLS